MGVIDDDSLKETEVRSVGISTQTDDTDEINIDELVTKICSEENNIYNSEAKGTPPGEVKVLEGSDCSSQKEHLQDLCSNMIGAKSFAVGQNVLEPSRFLDSKWSAEKFAPEQIWAVYDGSDHMPRSYVIVNWFSANEVNVTYLEPHPMTDDEFYWVEENLPFVSGLFKASKTIPNLQMYTFLHLVECQQLASAKKSFYEIYRRKGVCRNWDSRWKQSNLCQYECQIVEVISDFEEETETRTASLVKVQGCMTFFQRQFCDGFELIRTVSRNEMLSFSPRVVAFYVPGCERYGVPEGSWHLEQDALLVNSNKQF